ncbi:ABC transporter permease [Nocardia mexicana]|uniref:Peptide/nickel transport system permease protein n=1 Tax=Nocardia mexicana TaxID=279262 RepID=A0A370HD68_9NOCA|nr:ABC transporter permease [Nocardia mexicana]RDI52803.1 peptide/nickel transport system permease protein [Nocardia mexicana]
MSTVSERVIATDAGRRGGVWVAAAGLVLRRLALLFALLTLVFAAISLLPGDASRAALDRGATPEAVAAKRHELGLDRPLPQRFWSWLSGVVTGDFGTTVHGRSIADLLVSSAPQTLLLGGLAFALTVIASIGLGMWWAARPSGWVARVLQPATAMVVALPEFVVAAVLIMIFSFVAGWLPAVTVAGRSGFPATADMLVLPVLALAVPQTGWNTRVIRGALADAARAPHVENAELEGISPRQLMVRHVFPVALPAIAASYATTVGMLLGGALVVESLFNYPGLGALLAGSVADRDTALAAATAAVAGATIMCVLLAADGLRAWAMRGRR